MFPCDLSDLFHPDVPDRFIYWALLLMMARYDADWVLLTKRPEKMEQTTSRWLDIEGLDILPPNIWCLVTAENQRRADERIPILLQVKAQVRGVSLEPMLGPMVLEALLTHKLHWVIVGAESGPRRRPFDKSWAITLAQQCKDAEVPFFYKQSSGLYPGTDPYLFGQRVQEFPQT